MDKIYDPIFDKVLFIGPDKRGKGGIASVLNSYDRNFAPFHYLGTNVRDNKVLGYLRVIVTALRMPFARMKGRKIVHVHYASGKSWYRKVLLMKWARLLGFKVIGHCHAAEMREFSKRKGYDNMRRVLDKCAANIVLSQSWVDFFEQYIKCGNVFCVNNIVEPSVGDIESRDYKKPVTFLFLGYIGPRKGIFETLEAVSLLKKEGYNLKLIVGGNGETERLQAEIKRLGVEDLVDFRGWIDNDAKESVFAESDVFVLPSFNEGLPITILEAMSHGKGVVASPVGGIPEIIREKLNGKLITPGNIDELKNGLCEYIKNPSMIKEHGVASQAIIQAYYPKSVIEQLIEIYKEVVS
ncbi:MAG: glycosyltransferase family 4 protein [Muribaculaceae bacterium]|nr:glycosyltransferase family 4 protein [Muribaculaceae bacterium]